MCIYLNLASIVSFSPILYVIFFISSNTLVADGTSHVQQEASISRDEREENDEEDEDAEDSKDDDEEDEDEEDDEEEVIFDKRATLNLFENGSWKVGGLVLIFNSEREEW